MHRQFRPRLTSLARAGGLALLAAIGLGGLHPADAVGLRSRPGGAGTVQSRTVYRHVVKWYQRAIPDAGWFSEPPGAWRPARGDSGRWSAVSLVRGFELAPKGDWTLGIAIGYEPEAIRSRNGSEDTGVTVSPYLAFMYDSVGFDVAPGFVGVAPATAAGGSPPAGARPDRFFVAGALGYVQSYGQWVLSGRVGGLWVQTDPSLEDSPGDGPGRLAKPLSSHLGQVSFGADLGYSVGGWEPYLAGMVQYDVTGPALTETVAGRNRAAWGLGLRYRGEGLTGSIQWGAGIGSGALDGHRINLFIRRQFD